MEEWRDIPGFEGRYRVSDAGCVLSLIGRQKLLRPGLRSGYPSVVLSLDGRKRNFLVHILVITTFRGPCPDGLECRHIDGTRSNASLGNLEYGTHAENQQDMVRHGRSSQGERHHKAKLTDADVMAIRDDRRGKRAVARVYGVSVGTIGFIRSGRTWRHLLPGGV